MPQRLRHLFFALHDSAELSGAFRTCRHFIDLSESLVRDRFEMDFVARIPILVSRDQRVPHAVVDIGIGRAYEQGSVCC